MPIRLRASSLLPVSPDLAAAAHHEAHLLDRAMRVH
jgi:hypothetical protein